MMNDNNHTFAICAYGDSPYLEECVKSVVNQTVKSNIIVVTSTPNDEIYRICGKYELRLYVNTGEKGIAGDWNFALDCVDTQYVTITHQDDIYCEVFLAHIMRKVRASKTPIIIFTDYGEIRQGEKVNSTRMLKIKRLMLAPLKLKCFHGNIWIRRRILSLGSPICCPSVTYNLAVIDKPVFRQGFKAALDWEAWEKLSLLKGEFVYDSEILMYHRIHFESETSKLINDTGRGIEDYEMIRKFWPDSIAKLIARLYSKSETFNDIK